MGLRVEQQNIEDLLKYFIARNEFKRRNIVEILKDLSDEERAKLNISNYAEFFNYYKFLYKVLRQDLVEGAKTTIIDSTDLIGRSYYNKEFLLKYPFQYILELRLANELTKDYNFIYDTLEDNSWQDALTGKVVNLEDYGITVEGTPNNDDKLKVSYIAYNGSNCESAKIFIEQGNGLLKPTINSAIFGKKVRSLSDCNYNKDNTVDELFEKIINSNPEVNDTYDATMLISPEYMIYNNSESKVRLDDLFTFNSNIYFMSDNDVPGFSEKTKSVIILAALRKILNDRFIPYHESDYLINIKYDNSNKIESYDLIIDNLLNLVLNSNPLTKQDLPEGKEETFRTLQNEIINLKAYVNEYVVNETRYSDNKYFMKNGKANYSGYNLCTIIPHNTNLMPAGIIINNINPESIKDTGDVYVKSDNKNIYVYNTGKNRSEFEFNIVFDTGEYLEFPKEISFEDFVKLCTNSITKLKIDNDLIYKENNRTVIKLIDIDGQPLFHNFDFLIVNDKDNKQTYYYRVDDTELFEYNEDERTLTVISEDLNFNLNNSYYITAMEIDNAPIVKLLVQLLMNPNYYVQHVIDFMDLMFVPTDKEYSEYETVLGVNAVESLKNNKDIKFVDLTNYNVTDKDVLFVNGLAYSLVDTDHFKFFYTFNENDIDRRILLVYNFNIDEYDEIYVSRYSNIINPFDASDNDSSYDFEKYVYLTANSSFGHSHFKSDIIPIDENEEIEEEVYPFDPSSRMFNRHPLTCRIEGFHTHHAHHNCEYQSDIEYDDNYMYIDCYKDQHGFTSKVKKQSRYSIVSHKLGKTPNFVNINPFTSDINKEEGKFVGNIWWTADDENIYVYNDGNSECEFEWLAIYDDNCVKENLEYNKSFQFDKKGCLLYNVTHNNDTKLEYYGRDYIKYDKDTRQLTVHNSNVNNENYKYSFTYITGKHITNKKFLEYSDDFTSNQDGYFDKNYNEPPTGKEVLNYSGEFRSTKSRVYGNGIVQYLPTNGFDQFKNGDIVAYVNGVCKLANKDNYSTVIGVVVEEDKAAFAIDSYLNSKVPVALFGIQDVKVIGDIIAGEKLGLITDMDDLNGIATTGIYADNCYIGKALENYNNVTEVGTIKVLLTLV